jgi:hypothetical protein
MRRILLAPPTALLIALVGCSFPIKLELPSSCTDNDPATPCDDDSQAAELVSFRFAAANNPGLGSDVTTTISDTSLAATVPFGTDVTTLVATFQVIGESVRIGHKAQISSATPNDFTRPVVYTVTAVDGTTRDFTVTVTIGPDPGTTTCKLPDGAAIVVDSSQVAANLAGRWWLCGGAAEFFYHVEFTNDQHFYMLSLVNGRFVRNLGPTTSGTYSIDPNPAGISFSIHQLYQNGGGATYPLQGYIEATPRKLRLGGGYYVGIP